jgi:hypothetical protein
MADGLPRSVSTACKRATGHRDFLKQAVRLCDYQTVDETSGFAVPVRDAERDGFVAGLVVSGSSRTTTQFTVSNLQCNNGGPANVTANVDLFWIVVEPH